MCSGCKLMRKFFAGTKEFVIIGKYLHSGFNKQREREVHNLNSMQLSISSDGAWTNMKFCNVRRADN